MNILYRLQQLDKGNIQVHKWALRIPENFRINEK